MSSVYTESLDKADINITTIGDNVIIPAPGTGRYIAIDFIQYLANGAVIVQHKSGAVNYGGPYSLALGQSVTIENAIENEHGIITCADNSAFVMNLSGAFQVSGFIRYRIINK